LHTMFFLSPPYPELNLDIPAKSGRQIIWKQ